MKIRAVSLCILMLIAGAASAFGSEGHGVSYSGEGSFLQINPQLGYTYANIYGNGSVPTYRGVSFGAELTYAIGTPGLSVAPFLSYRNLSLENSANTSVQQEQLSGDQVSFGLMVATRSMYLKGNYSRISLKHEARGQVQDSWNLKSDGFGLGAGAVYQFTPLISSSLGLEVNTFRFDPARNPVKDRLDYVSYTLMFSVNIGIPSYPPELLP